MITEIRHLIVEGANKLFNNNDDQIDVCQWLLDNHGGYKNISEVIAMRDSLLYNLFQNGKSQFGSAIESGGMGIFIGRKYDGNAMINYYIAPHYCACDNNKKNNKE